MRIVGGKFKARGLAAPAGLGTRPTSDRLREAIFNILAHGIAGFALDGARVLDLFAGTGALGFEALSRGAIYCLFVEADAPARGVIRRNAEALGVIGQCRIWRRDAARLGACAPLPGFDLAFADPPYGHDLGSAALAAIASGGWLVEGGIAVVEEAARGAIACPSGLEEIDARVYGDTQLRLYRRPNIRSSSASEIST